MNKHLRFKQLLLLSTTILTIQLTSAGDFLFNGFGPSDVSWYGDTTIESRVISLTKHLPFSLGRAQYPSKIPTKQPNSSFVLPFSSSFVFAMTPYKGKLPGNGLMFVFGPNDGIRYSNSARHLGLFNFTDGDPNNHIFGVGFDTKVNHVGIHVNSIVSFRAHEAGYWPDDGREFRKLTLISGRNYQVWIDYVDGVVNVTMAPVGIIKRPNWPLLSVPLNLSDVFEDEMFVGFIAATGNLTQQNRLLSWSFSNTNFSLSEGLITRGLPNFELPKTLIHRTKGFIAGLISLGVLLFVMVVFLLVRMNKRIRKEREELMEDWELEYWPHRISYQEIESATNSFSEENVIGVGGNGKVYKGVFWGGSEVAVKRISRESNEGIRAFSAEISSIGRLTHRNLVGLRGWCKKEKSSLVLVYDYMENGSLDKRVFECDESKMLNCEERIKILKQVASGVMYLHYGWESKVLHRDIKASNVLLDKEMNARLGDFGLAQIHGHNNKVDGPTRVVGTVGYLAPEVVRNGRASTHTDVYGYGVLVLEVICGRRPIEQGKPLLVEWLWELLRKGELLSGVDPRLRADGEFDEEKVEKMLQLGLLCAHPDPSLRPTMRQVVKLFEENKTDEKVDEQELEEMYILGKIKDKEILCSLNSISWSNSIGVGR
ncbi:L-type lectin-domain containing receptor kinase vii.1 [Phtheirospermum japonicum]|uniref:non-specific serine/threonine protein kinase n=1 Tax=Phtheirospermum japonicum TaxID=374723 RepID=A0A830DMU9_9LAMI|nr:L-type lectin-domain containing receptor kinase vii.1 [Phtheirospermum japonicum]